FSADRWNDGHVGAMSARTDGLAVARATTSTRIDDRHVVMHFGFAVAYPDGRVDTYVEEHATSQFTVEEHLEAFLAAGLTAEHDPEGLMERGLYVAVKQP
ncbi:MAG: hypothetical protein KJN63_00755, partial [Acidimicrobiia bacterium]|nr:hypothetical protein [Acidimicrobiia bacterium]